MKPEETLDAHAMLRMTLVTEGGLAVLACVMGWFLDRPPWVQIDWTTAAVAWGLGATAPLVIGLVLLMGYPIGPIRSLLEVVRQRIVPLFRACALWQLLAISCLAGIAEEIMFRGVLQRGIEQFSGSPWLALAVASLLFGLAHPITPTYAVLAALIGVYLGGLLWATDNLAVPIITHAAYDFAALVYLLRRESIQESWRFP